MAGIGFELQRVLRRGGIGSLAQVAFAGIIIVAGPWLLSIVGIFLISRFAGPVLAEGQRTFISIVVYSYAFSLLLFGGTHFVFTRLVADLVYEERKREAGAALLLFSVSVLVLAFAVGWFGMALVDVSRFGRPLLFRFGSAALFAVINLLWIMMIFISMLKDFVGIFLSYLAGMAISVSMAIILGAEFGIGGAMTGFMAGQFAAGLFLAVLLLLRYRPGGFRSIPRLVADYFVRYRFLFVSGLLYYWAIWADKVILWITNGSATTGSLLRLYDPYDVPVYLASLTMIPGLVYFVVILETDFYIDLMRFLKSVQGAIFRTIQTQKYRLLDGMHRGLREQSAFQGIITLALFLLAGVLLPALGFTGVSILTARILVVGVYFQFLFLTLETFLFYMEFYPQAAASAAVYFLLNLCGTLSVALLHLPNWQGVGYVVGGAAGSLVAYRYLARGGRHLERLVLARYSEG